MSGGVLLQAVISGLSVGAVYGLVGLGFTLVWSLTRVLALAHGDVVVGAVLIAVLAVVGRTPVASSPDTGHSLLLVLLTLVAGVVLAVASYAVAIRPFLDRTHRSADVLGWVAGTVTAGLVIRTALGLALPAAAYAVPDPLHLDGISSSGVVDLPGDATVTVRSFAVFGVAVAVAVVVDWFIRRSRLGRGMRAVADDVDSAALCGVNIERVVVWAFVLAGLLAAIAALLDSPGHAVAVDSGALLGLAGAAAALLGGLGSPRGALLGGLALGVAQQLVASSTHLGASWATTLPLAVLVAVVAIRPEGFGAGRRVVVE
jgi:branched-subunit amino acid ABC-type transport system permease component